jgi:hypothetical protein
MNILSILVTAFVPMVLGFVWYHPKVFGTAWMRLSGMTEEKAKQGNMALKLGLSYLFSMMIVFVLSSAIVVHDGFVKGALYYMTNRGTVKPQPGSDAAKWLDYYTTTLAASNHTFSHGSFHGFFLIGLFIVLPVIATNAIFERKNFKYVMLNAGYWILSITIMGGILAVWR